VPAHAEAVINHNASFVLLLRVAGRIFAITFGHGFTALHRGRLEPDFGLKVTLNTVDPQKLRALQARNIDPATVSKQLVVSHNSELSVFDVDLYQELLSKMDGVPDAGTTGPTFGSRISGADACYLTSDITVPALPGKCRELLKHYTSRKYTKHFSFVDQVRPIRDDAIINRLDRTFVEALSDGTAETLGFALPDITSYEAIAQYRASRNRCLSSSMT
jgi:uncharacterized protein (TIGR04141 family)